MDKAFEALTRMDDLYCAICPHTKGDCNECEYNQKSNIVYQALNELKAIKEAKPSEAIECLEWVIKNYIGNDYYKYEEELITIKQVLLKVQDQDKENEILKEIIKSFFDRGCPLHQYIDEDFGLTIEVDNECSIMHLGKFKGVDLNEKLKEVLE